MFVFAEVLVTMLFLALSETQIPGGPEFPVAGGSRDGDLLQPGIQ